MELIIQIYIFFIGMLIFSFYTLVGYRIPIKKSINGRSVCENCEKNLKLIDVIPVLGYLLLKGKCRHCNNKINPLYPILELFGGLLFLSGYFLYGFNLDYLIYLILISILYIESISDIYHTYVSDRILLIGYVCIVIIRFVQNSFFDYFLGSISIFTILYLISFVGYKVYKKVILGMGDVKLYLVVGMFLPFIHTVITFYLGAIFALIVYLVQKNKPEEIKFVPYLSLGIFIMFLYGEELIDMYLSLF